MASVRSLKRVKAAVWKPPVYGALYKIEITRLDGTITDDITDIIFEGEVIDGVTDTIGNFSFTLDNSGENYTGVWSGGEILRLYIDYATSATTARFRGRIEKVSYQDQKIKIIGRSYSAKLLDITVTQTYSDMETSEIVKDLLDNYASDITYTNVNESDTNVTITWYQKPFWECIRELCHASGFDAYVDSNLDFHYFESGTINNTTEAVVHDSNLFEVGDFAYDHSLIKNRIIIYGANIGDLPLIYTTEDSGSISDYGIKELIIQDTNIVTMTQAEERADYELNLSKDPPLMGDVTSIGLATIQPGENVRISAPSSNLNPNYYKILTYKHKFEGFMKTTLTIEKEPKKIYHILRDRISNEQNIAEMPNPNEMRFSWNFDFESETGNHTNTEIIDGVLKTVSGQTTGTWISDVKTLDNNVIACDLRAAGTALSGTLWYVSTDSGQTWQTISNLNTNKNLIHGKNLRIKVELKSASTQINSLCLLYR